MPSAFCRAFSVKPSVFNEFEIVPYHEPFRVITLLASSNNNDNYDTSEAPPTCLWTLLNPQLFFPDTSELPSIRIRWIRHANPQLFESALLSGNFFMLRFESGIVLALNQDYILSDDVARSSPVLYRECCIQDGNLVPRCSQGRARCKFCALYDACSVANIPRGVLGTRVNPDTCRICVDGQIRFAYRIRVDVRIF